MPLSLHKGEGRVRPVLHVEEAAKIHHSLSVLMQVLFVHRRGGMQVCRLSVCPIMEVRQAGSYSAFSLARLENSMGKKKQPVTEEM